MHPPADRRCQIYVTVDPVAAYHAAVGSELFRCVNEGTHWERWSGCGCDTKDDAVCEDEFFSWECSGEHDVPEVLNASA